MDLNVVLRRQVTIRLSHQALLANYLKVFIIAFIYDHCVLIIQAVGVYILADLFYAYLFVYVLDMLMFTIDNCDSGTLSLMLCTCLSFL
jgi:hypothetical protein